MEQKQDPTAKPDLDTRILSDFIYELNIARRQLSLYPPGHPQILSSSENVLDIFSRLCQFREGITFGIAPEALLFEGEWLDRDNPVYRDLARFLANLEIASIHFKHGLTTAEVVQLNRILSSDLETIRKQGGFPALLQLQQLQHVEIVPVDYDVFQTDTSGLPANDTDADLLWDDFLHGLIGEQLDRDGRALDMSARLDAQRVAEILNQSRTENGDKGGNYDRAISSFIARMQDKNDHACAEIGGQIAALAAGLNAADKRNFLNSTFRALNRHPHTAQKILQTLPQEMVASALQQHSENELNLSSRLIDLLGHFSTSGSPEDNAQTAMATELPGDETTRARIDILLLEDNHDDYLPNEYQQTLEKILTGQVRGNLPAEVTHELKHQLDTQSAERQCCAIIFNMLCRKVEPEVEETLQNSLTELTQYFLDTGDFITLREIFTRWSNYLYSDHARARFLDEKVLAAHSREGFMNEVLDSVERWGEEKYPDISAYIVDIGEPYAELLVARLAEDEVMTRRKTWMKLLVELGAKGHQIISKCLEDERWYLVRNLLIVLGRQHDVLPAKAVHQLTGHAHPKVRQEALRILFRINPATANRLLLKELSSGNRAAISAAIQLAELSGDEKILQQLHRLVQAELQNNDDDLTFKKTILDALALKGRPETIPVLAKLLRKKSFIRPRREKDFHLEIIKHLGAFPKQACEPLLNSIINGRDRTQSRLAQAQMSLPPQTEAPQ